jgi:hypothetical protein
MADARISIHIAHAEWMPERKDTLARLMAQLEPQGVRPHVHRSQNREHSSVWATRMYKAAAAGRCEADVFLNDDVEVSPHLVAAVRAQLQAPTSRIVSLHTVHPVARSLAESGLRWMRTYHVTGPAYYFRRGTAQQALDYYADVPKAWSSKANEDNVLISMMFRHREPIWNAMPGLVQHDTGVPSSLGYENHPQRVCCVPWNDAALYGDLDHSTLGDPAFWKPDGEVPFLDTHWTQTGTLVRQEVCNDLGIPPEWCWWCLKSAAAFGSPTSGASICPKCLHDTVGGTINAAVAAAPRRG